MSAIEGLLRVHRQLLDERRRRLATLEELAAKLDEEQRRLDGDDAGRQGSAHLPDAGALTERRRNLAQSRAEVAGQIEGVRAALAEASRDVKRHEIVAANRSRQQRLREERRTARNDNGRPALPRRAGPE